MPIHEKRTPYPGDPNLTRTETTTDDDEVIGVRYEGFSPRKQLRWGVVARSVLPFVLIAFGFWLGLQVGTATIA